ncbi:hypothetical protein OV079_38260 [Nannocystis pusilla]|uniref:Uncharacterized protein n=1 Tax=Nannocystis pusilla TaxID=889268 RepID=A0A9X3J163_9BACT|nr:hypothetical protein [Nannocystis pusilla]MCY1011306.1 hypothetical protein [Nannocystis pusilla]
MDIRCPGCGAAHPEYGTLGDAATPPARPTVAELLVTTFPPRAPRAAQIRVGRLVVERFVLLLAGPLPPPSMLADFVETACASMIELMLRAPVRGGAVPLNVLAVDSLFDDTQWLSALLDTHVYRGTLGVRVFASLGPLEAPSGTQVLLCPVGSGPTR